MVSGGLDVIMGAGHPRFDNSGTSADPDYTYVGGEATWRDLTDGNGRNGFTFIDTKEQFEALAARAGTTSGSLPRKVVGIARCRDTLQYRRPGKQMAPQSPLNPHVPSLKTMTRAAISVLSQQPEGFLLMVEGGAVDWANHDNNLPRMIEEQIDFNAAVAAVVDWVEASSSWDETLLIITSDHGCGMLWGPDSYHDSNGNGQRDADEPPRRFTVIENRGAGQLPGGTYFSGGHTNLLVPLWAKGAGSDAFHQLVDGRDPRAGRFWGFSGKYVDNTDVFRAIDTGLRALAPATPETRQRPAEAPAAR
jgi:alkaline phosphatase